MKIVIVSDTHGRHESLGVLEGDILLHCGDLCDVSDSSDYALHKVDLWFGQQKFKQILCVGGNHDLALEQRVATGTRPILRHATYLEDDEFIFEGVKFFGLPWVPQLYSWSYFQEDEVLRQKWAQIPDDVDVLMTHTPPWEMLDVPTLWNEHLGCRHLRERVAEIRPKIHCFGHVHASYGYEKSEGTTFVNASIFSRKGLNRPVVINL